MASRGAGAAAPAARAAAASHCSPPPAPAPRATPVAAIGTALIEKALSFLDARSLAAAEAACREWRTCVRAGRLWLRFALACGGAGGGPAWTDADSSSGGGEEPPADPGKQRFVDCRAAERLARGRVRSAASLSGHAAAISEIRSPDRRDLVITASADGGARVWDLSGGGRQLYELRHAAPVVAAAALAPDVAVTATAAAAHLWRRGARARSFPLEAPRTHGPITRIAVAGTDLVLASASSRVLQVFDLYSGSLRLMIRAGESGGGGSGGGGGGGGEVFPPAAASGGGGGTSSLEAAERPSGAWAAAAGAPGGAAACHCLAAGRLLWRLRSGSAAALVGLRFSKAAGCDMLIALDAASQLHVWEVPGWAPAALDAGGGGGGGGPGGARAPLASCGLPGLGAPTSLAVFERGGGHALAGGWGGAVAVARVRCWLEERARRGGGRQGRGGAGRRAAGDDGRGGGDLMAEISLVRSIDLSRLRPRGGAAAEPAPAPAPARRARPGAGGASRPAPAAAQGGAKAPAPGSEAAPGPAAAPAAATGSGSNGGGGGGSGGSGGSQWGVLALEALDGCRLLVGSADGSVRLLRFGDPPPGA